MVKNIALAALVGLFATATFAEGDAKEEKNPAVASDAGKDGKDEKKPEEKKDEKHEEKK